MLQKLLKICCKLASIESVLVIWRHLIDSECDDNVSTDRCATPLTRHNVHPGCWSVDEKPPSNLTMFASQRLQQCPIQHVQVVKQVNITVVQQSPHVLVQRSCTLLDALPASAKYTKRCR